MKTSILPADTLSGYNIMIADDEPLMQQLLKNMLARYGAEDVVLANDGEMAMQQFSEHDLQLIFLDIEMPGKNGLWCLERMRAQRKDGIFFCFVSGHGTLENVQQAQRLGVNGFMVKPYTARKVEDMIKNFLKTRA